MDRFKLPVLVGGSLSTLRAVVDNRMWEIDKEVRVLKDERAACEQFLQACNKLFPKYGCVEVREPHCRVCKASPLGDVLDDHHVCSGCIASWLRYRHSMIARKQKNDTQ